MLFLWIVEYILQLSNVVTIQLRLLYFTKNLSFFLASYDTLDDPCEGRRPCLERSSRRSLARAEGPV